jgi:hypothetical protein
MFDCNGGVYTQTTDVEGEVNGASLFGQNGLNGITESVFFSIGFMTYDREVDHVDTEKWKAAIQALYDTFNTKVAGSQDKLSRKDLMM